MRSIKHAVRSNWKKILFNTVAGVAGLTIIITSWALLHAQITNVETRSNNNLDYLEARVKDAASRQCCTNISNGITSITNCISDGSCVGGDIDINVLNINVLDTILSCTTEIPLSCSGQLILSINSNSLADYNIEDGQNILIPGGDIVSTTEAVVFTTLTNTESIRFGTTTSCVKPLASNCYNISGQSCVNGPLLSSCMPPLLVFETIIVENLFIINVTNVPIGNQTLLNVNYLFVSNETLSGTFTGGRISNQCINLGGYACSSPLGSSCVPSSLPFLDLNSTDKLSANRVVCLGGPVNCVDISGQVCASSPISDACMPARVKTINGIGPTLSFDILPGTGISGTILLANTGVTPGAYDSATIDVNAQGQLTFAQSGVPPVLTIDSTSSIFNDTFGLSVEPANLLFVNSTFAALEIGMLPQMTNYQTYIGNGTSTLMTAFMNIVGTVLSTPQNINTLTLPQFAKITDTVSLTLGNATLSATGSHSFTLPTTVNSSYIVTGNVSITNSAIATQLLFGTSGSTSSWQNDPANTKVTMFNANGNFTFQPLTTFIQLILISGGGGGGSGATTNTGAGPLRTTGGAGGGTSSLTGFFPVTFFSSPVTVVVGAGGSGASQNSVFPSAGVAGSPGGASSFGTITTPPSPAGAGGTINGVNTASTNCYEFDPTSYGGIVAVASGGAGTGNAGAAQAGVNRMAFTFGPTGGGGGGGGYDTTSNAGQAAGGSLVDYTSTIRAGGTAASGGSNPGGNGLSSSSFTFGGTGGGGGAGTVFQGPTGGNGGNGGAPGGGGGGGGGGSTAYARPSGAGGTGGTGRVTIIEYF